MLRTAGATPAMPPPTPSPSWLTVLLDGPGAVVLRLVVLPGDPKRALLSPASPGPSRLWSLTAQDRLLSPLYVPAFNAVPPLLPPKDWERELQGGGRAVRGAQRAPAIVFGRRHRPGRSSSRGEHDLDHAFFCLFNFLPLAY